MAKKTTKTTKSKILAASRERVEAQKSDKPKMDWTLYTRWANQR
jgi:hypothetical protein